IKMLSRVDFSDQRNLMIMAVSIGMGLGVTVVPEMFAIVPESIQVVTESGIVMGSLTAIILNFIYHIGDMGYIKSKNNDEASLTKEHVTEYPKDMYCKLQHMSFYVQIYYSPFKSASSFFSFVISSFIAMLSFLRRLTPPMPVLSGASNLYINNEFHSFWASTLISSFGAISNKFSRNSVRCFVVPETTSFALP